MKSLITSNFLERMLDSSQRQLHHLARHRDVQLTKHRLIERFPHVALLGDSACMDIYISSPWSTFWRARTSHGGNWFRATGSPQSPIRSVFERLVEITPVVATEYSGIGALVDHEHARANFCRRIIGTRNLSGQINKLLRTRRLPDLILIAIGHNNVDWAWRCPADELNAPEGRLKNQSQQLRRNYTRELRRLLAGARAEERRVAIIVFGLINFESYFKGRETAERLRKADGRLYPHLETTYKHLISFHPAYRRNVIRLASMMNEELRSMVEELNREIEADRHIQLRYSDALAKADLSRPELLHPVDAWHASTEGHRMLAQAAFNDLGPSLKFLEIE